MTGLPPATTDRALAAMLAHEGTPGVFRWHPDHDRRTERDALQRGWHVASLDTTGAPGKTALLAGVQLALGFPEWFGHNWDALADALSDVEQPGGSLLLWSGWESLMAGDIEAFEMAVEILAERAQTPELAPFVVLLLEGCSSSPGRSGQAGGAGMSRGGGR